MSSKQPTSKDQPSKGDTPARADAPALPERAPKATPSSASFITVKPEGANRTERQPSSYAMEQWLQQSSHEDPWNTVSRIDGPTSDVDQSRNGSSGVPCPPVICNMGILIW